MTKQTLIQNGTPVQPYRHPTPVEIETAILRVFREAPEVEGELPIPVRVYGMIEQGVADACKAVTA